MNRSIKTLILASMLSPLLVLAGCEEEGPAEQAGEQIDEAAEEVQEAGEQAGEELDQATEEVQENTQ